ncbi:hypothetical protein MRB53_040330 [Persea americana]|nr:hypothetical protein MRB53_040330 [Persea americana]
MSKEANDMYKVLRRSCRPLSIHSSFVWSRRNDSTLSRRRHVALHTFTHRRQGYWQDWLWHDGSVGRRACVTPLLTSLGLTITGAIPHDAAFQPMRAALEAGANFWNGGTFYGPPEASSLQLLRAYLDKFPADASRIFLSLKGAYDSKNREPRCSPEEIRASVDDALAILDGRHPIDLFECARVDRKVPVETTVRTLAELITEGKIGAYGLSEASPRTIRAAHAVHPCAAVEIELSLFTREALQPGGVMDTCRELGIPVVAYSPLDRGWLSDKLRTLDDLPPNDMRRMFPRFQPGAFEANVKLADVVRGVAERKRVTAAQVALAWVRAQGALPIPGSTRVEGVKENCVEVELSAGELCELQEMLKDTEVQGFRYPEVLQATLNGIMGITAVFSSWPAFKAFVQTDTPVREDGSGKTTRWSNEGALNVCSHVRALIHVARSRAYSAGKENFTNWTLGSVSAAAEYYGHILTWLAVLDRHWPELVACHHHCLRLTAHLLRGDGVEQSLCWRVPYRLSHHSPICLWNAERTEPRLIHTVFFGANYVYNMLRAIFGHHFTDIPNHLPKSAGITTSLMLCFFLFWLVHLPFCHFRPYQLRKFFWFKTIISLPAVFGLFIFCMANTKGHLGPLYSSKVQSQSSLAWAIINGINIGMGCVPCSDRCRDVLTYAGPAYALTDLQPHRGDHLRNLRHPLHLCHQCGVGTRALVRCDVPDLGRLMLIVFRNQWDLMNAIMDRYWHGTTRFAIFLASFAWCVQTLGTNIAANMIPFGADSAMLFPSYINIRRGQYLVEFLAWAAVPWKIIASASVFTTFLAGYGLFMASVVAIMVCEYFVLTKGNLSIRNLYDGSPSNTRYYYFCGWNLQALAAYLCGIALPFPGFVGSLGANVSSAARHMGDMGWILSFVTSFVMYIAICKVFPTANQRWIKENGLSREILAIEAERAGDFDGSGRESGSEHDVAFEQYGKEKDVGVREMEM